MGNLIRPAGPLDLLPLSVAPAQRLPLDVAQQLLSPHHPLRDCLASWLRLQEPLCTLICRGEDGARACAQARPGTQSWELCYLAAWHADVEQAYACWEELLAALGAEAGQRGTVRLLARLPVEEHLELFQRAGFHPFAEEMLLVWESKDRRPPARPLPALQPVRAEHLWAIQQLHLGLTPPRVHQAEDWSEDSWHPRRGEESWVWEEAGRALAYLRRRQGPRTAVLDLLLDPACRQHVQEVLAHGLAGTRPPVHLVLRSYQGELLDVARRLGFRSIAEQILLVKHLAVPVEQRQPVSARNAERKLGAAPSAPSVGNV
jgi:hypothetical protein